MTAGLLSDRSSGILLHVTSLPGAHGIGDLGPAAYAFAEFARARRRLLLSLCRFSRTRVNTFLLSL